MKRSILAVVLCVGRMDRRDRPVAGAACARHRVRRARLDAEHQPHRHLRGAEARVLRGGRHRPQDPALRQHRARDARRATARPTSASPTRRVSPSRAAAGDDVTSVFAVLQHTALEIGVRADRTDITTPKDLDGKTYAGFGTPDEKPLLRDRDPRRRRQGRRSRTSRSTRPPTTPSTAARPTSRCRSRPGRSSRPGSSASR